jgi:hypothetical protein
VTNYYRSFVATTEVIEERWGKIYPEKLAVRASDADKKRARDKYLSMIFLARAEVEDLHNSYLAGNDHPMSLDGTLTLLSHYQGHQGGKHMDRQQQCTERGKFCPVQPVTSAATCADLLLELK